jgi:phosphate transport system permease protein
MKKSIASSGKIRAESLFRQSLVAIGVLMVVLVAGVLLTLIIESIPSIKHLGLKYLWGTTWDPFP